MNEDQRTKALVRIIDENPLPKDLWEFFAADPNPLVRRALVGNHRIKHLTNTEFEMPASVEVELSADPDPKVRAEIARRTKNPELLSAMFGDQNQAVLAEVAGNPHTPLEALRGFLESDDPAVLEALAWNKSIDPQVALALVEMEVEPVLDNAKAMAHIFRMLGEGQGEADWNLGGYDLVLARNPATPISVLEVILSRGRNRALMELARRDDLMPPMYRQLAEDDRYTVRTELAGNTACPQQLLEALANDEDTDVVYAVVTNESAGAVALAIAAQNYLDRQGSGYQWSKYGRGIAKNIAIHPNADDAALILLSQSPDDSVVLAVASSYKATDSVLATLGLSKKDAIASAAISNKNCSKETLQMLSKHARRRSERNYARQALEWRAPIEN